VSDTTAIILALVGGMPATLAAVGALVVTLRRQSETKQSLDVIHKDVTKTKEALAIVHDDVNSKMQQFIETSKTAAYAEGVKSETDKKVDGV